MEKMMNKKILPLWLAWIPLFIQAQAPARLITVEPGHFHAALVQKIMYPNVDSTAYIYAPEGKDLNLHLQRIEGYNKRSLSPTSWNTVTYTGKDFFERMIAEKKGNVVMLSGNNKLKTDYILKAVRNGFHVYADKPMAIDIQGFKKLKQAFAIAKKNKLLLYDIMTERYEITTILQRAFSMERSIFGELERGSVEEPSITKESVHHFYKYVSGNILTRPAWFFDVNQEGEGIVDVTTHLVDLIQWECFPEQIINYKKDVKILTARSWNTMISQEQFMTVTKENEVPRFLMPIVDPSGNLQVRSNGEFTFLINGIHAKVAVRWDYAAQEGSGDTHYSLMHGTKADLVIKQGEEEKYKPTLFIEPRSVQEFDEKELNSLLEKIKKNYPGIQLKKRLRGWEVIVPEAYKEGHEAHFSRVTEKFLDYLTENNMPQWEITNMIAKYYITTQAKKLAEKQQ
jgi:predicted dehydrogenase